MTQRIEYEKFLQGLQDENPAVRWVTAFRLKSWVGSGSADLLKTALAADASPKVRAVAALSLGYRGAVDRETGMFEPLAGALSDEDPEVRAVAAKWLGRLKDSRAFAPLMGALTDKHSEVRESALRSLGYLVALDLANRHDHEARKSAIEGLLKFRDTDAVAALLFALGDDDFEVKVAANQALIALGDPQPFERLSRVIEFRRIDGNAPLQRAYSRLRGEAVKALGKLGDPRGIRLLLEALDSIKEIQEAANQALIDLGDPEPYDRLAKLIQYPRWQLGRSAFAQLAERGGVRAIEILSRALTDDDPEVKLKAASALITLSDAPKFDALLILLSDGEKWQRQKAAEALGAQGDLRAVGPLLDALRDDDREARYTASIALMDLGDPEPEKHRVALREKDHDDAIEVLQDWKASGELASMYAVRTLCELGDPDASSILERVMEESPSDGLAYKVIVALGELGAPSTIHTLMKTMVDEDADSDVRGAAEQAVIDIVNKERESGLSYLLDELQYGEPVQIEAARLLGQLGDESVVEDLKGLTQEEDFSVRAAAERALQKLESRGIKVNGGQRIKD